MSKRRKSPLERKVMEEPFGHPPKEYNYRCSVCGTELLVNEAIFDAGIGMAKFNKEYYEGYMPKGGCPGCNNRYPRYSEGYYEEQVERMLSCGNPEEMGYIGYLCMSCGQGSRVVSMSCKSSLCLRCGKVYVDEWVSQVSKTCPHENG